MCRTSSPKSKPISARRSRPPSARARSPRSRREAKAASPPRGFLRAIERRIAGGDYALIAEIKKASPSKGLIRADFDPPTLARAYEAGGASLSLRAHRRAVVPGQAGIPRRKRAAPPRLPALRKDFIYEPYQVVESRALGADCILIIMAAVDDAAAQGDRGCGLCQWHGRFT